MSPNPNNCPETTTILQSALTWPSYMSIPLIKSLITLALSSAEFAYKRKSINKIGHKIMPLVHKMETQSLLLTKEELFLRLFT